MLSKASLPLRPDEPPGPRVGLVLHNLGGGGIQRSMLRLAEGLISRGFAVDFVVSKAEGALLEEVPKRARIIELDKVHLWRARARGLAADPAAWRLLLGRKRRIGLRRLPSMVAYFRNARPDAV